MIHTAAQAAQTVPTAGLSPVKTYAMTPLCIEIIEDTPQRFECAVSDRSGEILQRWSVTAPKPWIMAMHRIAILDVAIPNFNAQLYINSKGIHIG